MPQSHVANDLDQAGFDRLAAQFLAEPAYQFVGLNLDSLSYGYCRTTTPVRHDLLHHRGAVQGGILAMIADATAGYTALSLVTEEQPGCDAATIEYKTSYFRPALADTLVCVSKGIFTGRSTVFCRAEMYLDFIDDSRLCAESTLTFKKLRQR